MGWGRQPTRAGRWVGWGGVRPPAYQKPKAENAHGLKRSMLQAEERPCNKRLLCGHADKQLLVLLLYTHGSPVTGTHQLELGFPSMQVDEACTQKGCATKIQEPGDTWCTSWHDSKVPR